MVTHEVDETLYLADRLLLMTDGPAAMIGETLAVPFPRPRQRAAVLEHPDYYACHQHVIDFLDHHARVFARPRNSPPKAREETS